MSSANRLPRAAWRKTYDQVMGVALASGPQRSPNAFGPFQNLHSAMKTLRSPSRIRMSDAALDVLDQIGTEGKFDYVFTNPDTKEPFVHIRHTWGRIREKAGMPWLRLHDLRHSYESMLINAGCSLIVVQQALGHADSRVTQRYSHLSSQTLMDAANLASLKIMEAVKKVA